MTSTFRRVVFFIAALGTVALAQPEGRRPPLPLTKGPVSFEAISFFAGDSSSAIVNIHYRIKRDFFVVQRNLETPQESAFLGKGDLIVELRNEQGNSVAREIRPIVLNEKSMPTEQTSAPDLQGSFSLKVPPGKYAIWFNVDDAQSERSFVSKDKVIEVHKPDVDALEVSDPVLVKPSEGAPIFLALNHGSNASFGERGGYLFALRVPSPDSPLSVHYTLTLHTEYKQLDPQEFQGDSLLAFEGLPKLDQPANDGKNASIAPITYRPVPTPPWKTFYLPLPLEKLQPGSGTLSIDFRLGTKVKHRDFSFRVFWLDRPQSLSDLELAAEALQHIATDQEMEEFHTFSDARFVRAFMDFWKKRDRDTTTAYNEMMAEYYRRVDAANKMFSSNREVDGYKSDRGRIYILYGAATHTQRLFSPDHPPREVWTYTNLGKRFVFEDQARVGTYILVSTENL